MFLLHWCCHDLALEEDGVRGQSSIGLPLGTLVRCLHPSLLYLHIAVKLFSVSNYSHVASGEHPRGS